MSVLFEAGSRGTGSQPKSVPKNHARRLQTVPAVLPSWSCDFDSRHPLHSIIPAATHDLQGRRRQPSSDLDTCSGVRVGSNVS